MFTVNSILNAFCAAGKLQFEGKHYDSEEPVYSGDLWRLWPDPEGRGLESRKQDRLRSAMENKSMQLRFPDEIISDDNGLVHELNPGFHGQTPTFRVMDDSQVWSQKEALDNKDAYIEHLLQQDKPSDRWLDDIDLVERNFRRFDYEAESGFHHGQNDTPETVIKRLQQVQPEAEDFLYQITDVGQFDVHWVVWYRLPEEEEEGA